VMKQVKDSYPAADFPIPAGMEVRNVGGSFFSRGERYYLTREQLALLDQEPSSPTAETDNHAPSGKGLIDRFLDIFR